MRREGWDVGVVGGDWPRWADLPDVAKGARSAWSAVEPADQLGTLARLTPELTARPTSLVRTGRRIPMHLPVGEPAPPLFDREPVRHEAVRRSAFELDDRLDAYYPQSGSQWDALGHFGSPRLGFYGGRSIEDVERGELGRWTGWHQSLGEAAREDVARRSRGEAGRAFAAVGVAPGRAWAELLWDAGAAAIAADNPGVDALPVEPGWGSLHVDEIALLGLTLGELFALAVACREARRWDFLFIGVPLPLPRGIGSPANAVAVL